MHYTVKFTGSKAEKDAQALAECRRWMGKKKFEKWASEVQGWLMPYPTKQKLRMMYIAASFVGVSGRAVIHALYRYLFVPTHEYVD